MKKNQHVEYLLDLEKLYNDALYFHLIHKGYTPEQAERKFKLQMILKMGINDSF